LAIFYQHTINEGTKIGIWRIEEPEKFFMKKVPVKNDVSNPYKRLQHLAGRYLLPALFADFPLEEILIADTRKPFLENEKYHFSISHCGNYAAAIVSRSQRVGVDIEWVTPRLRAISKKFLNEEEKNYLLEWEHLPQLHLELMTIIWSAKEAIFKWHGNGGLDFKKHIRLNDTIVSRPDKWIQMAFILEKDKTIPLQVMARSFDGLILAYVMT
jgi:4'-phosphopantetheinyl transferase EntD